MGDMAGSLRRAVLLGVLTWFQGSFSTAFGLKCQPHSSFPHPLDCGSFYLCGVDMDRHHFRCPEGLLYSEKKKTCDWATNVNCNLTEKLQTLKEDIRLLELVKKHGLDIPNNNTDEATDNPVLAAIFDLEEKCISFKEMDTENLDKEYPLSCGETLLPYLYQTLEELDDVYNLTKLLDKGESEYSVGLMHYKPPVGTESSVVDDKDEDRENKKTVDEEGLTKEGEDTTAAKEEDKEQTIGVYEDQNKQQVDEIENEFKEEKNNVTATNKTNEESYTTVESNVEKRETADDKNTEEGNPTMFLYRTRLIIDNREVNKSVNISTTDTEYVVDNSTMHSDNSTDQPLQYQPHFPPLTNDSGKMQLDLLGYEAADVIFSNETSTDDIELAEQDDKVEHGTTPQYETTQEERHTTLREDSTVGNHSLFQEQKDNLSEQESLIDHPKERNTTKTEEENVKDAVLDLEETSIDQTTLKDQQETNTKSAKESKDEQGDKIDQETTDKNSN